MFDHVVLKDKKDLTPTVLAAFPGAHVLGAMQSITFDCDPITILSVKFSRVGDTTFDRYPHLRAIVVRAHGLDTIDERECARRKIRVITTAPTSVACGAWLNHKLPSSARRVVIFGSGAIGQQFLRHRPAAIAISTSTPATTLVYAMSRADALVFAVPLTERTRHFVNDALLQHLTQPITLVSLSRGGIFDNAALIRAADRGMIREAHLDMIDGTLPPLFQHYHHTAWAFLPQDDIAYAQLLKHHILSV